MLSRTIPQDATRIRFDNPASEDRYWWTIQCSNSRYVVCTRQRSVDHDGTLTYTIVDLQRGLRGVIDYRGAGVEDRCTASDCRRMLCMLDHPNGNTTINNTIPLRMGDFR